MNSTKEFDIDDSNQTKFNLKNISEYCGHLTADVVSNTAQYIVRPFDWLIYCAQYLAMY